MSAVSAPQDLLAELTWRGLIAEKSQGLEERLAKGPISAYIGFDASARSLHVGHLLQVFMLTHLQRAGGTPFVIIGGGTGMVGDPSGKSSERQLTARGNRAVKAPRLGTFEEVEDTSLRLSDLVADIDSYRK